MINENAARAAKAACKHIEIKTSLGWRPIALLALSMIWGPAMPATADSQAMSMATITQRLKSAYPNHIADISNGSVIFKDGSRLQLDDGKRDKSLYEWLSAPDIEDMFRFDYRPSSVIDPPPANYDPGRARNAEFFNKIYGNCSKDDVAKHLVDITWLPKKSASRIKITSQNGVAEKLRAVSAELDELPSRFDVFLLPTAGTYVCRSIAGTHSPSTHGYGIAIDIAIANADYWRWSKQNRTLLSPRLAEAAARHYRNRIPIEIVQIFEKHSFIWGGRWYHYDTMHFEYRPELLPPKS